MKRIKKNKFLIIAILFLVGFSVCGLFEYNSSYNFMLQNYRSMKDKCDQSATNIQEVQYNYCKEIMNEDPPQKLDAFNLTFYIINYTSFSYILPFLPLFVIAFGIKKFYSELKSGIFRNIILITEYKKYIFSSFRKILKYSFIIPVVIILIFIISGFYTKNFNFNTIFNLGKNYIPIIYSKNIMLFCFIYLLNLLLHSLFWLNLGIICVKKSRNYIVSAISSYILYLGYSIIMEILSGLFLSQIEMFSNIYGYVKPGNIWGYDGVNSLLLMTFYGIGLVMTSLLIIFIKYRKKECVIIANEV